MSSKALDDLKKGVDEVKYLRRLSPLKDAIATGVKASTARAHGRACVVLLNSHYERYLRAVNEEALNWLIGSSIKSEELPEIIRLMHSRAAIDRISETNWDKRGEMLVEFADIDAKLWSKSTVLPSLESSKILIMKAPHSREVKRFYAMYGIIDIFSKATRRPDRRSHLWLKLQEMVDKRNNIAHGDFTTEALPSEISSYLDAVLKFCSSSDKIFAKQLKTIAKSATLPW